MIALVYLYLTGGIFMYGGELNSAIYQPRAERFHRDRTRKPL
jgi:uncharacterized BrkB/YihY/UPF0761 family membrane protein